MVKIKEMPYQEKYASVLSYIKREALGPSFIEQQLGSQALAEFQKECQKGVKPISESASYQEKYETAFSNLMWMGGTKFSFIRSRLGEDGIKRFIRADVDATKKDNSSPALLLLRLIRAISPGMAFAMTAKQMAYKLQFAGPYSISELSRSRMVMDVPRCKFLDFPGGEESCIIGCQRVTPAWLIEQFGIDMKANRQGNDCTLTFTPYR